MRKIHSFITGGWICIVLFLVSGGASARDTALEELLADIKTKSAAITSLTCDFTQTRSLALFNKPIVFEGRLAIIRPDRLRWEFMTPAPSVLIFNGDKGMRCNAGSEAAEFDLRSDPVMKMVADQLWTWLDGDYFKLENTYHLVKTGDSSLLVTPLEKQTAHVIKDISILFDDASRQVQSVTIQEPGGDVTSILFSGYDLNPDIPDNTFNDCLLRD